MKKMTSQRIFLFLLILPLAVFVSSVSSLATSAPSTKPPPPPQPKKLVWHFYKVYNTCDDAEVYIRYQVKLFWDKDKSITPKLLRLLYSDCFVTVRTHNTFIRQLFVFSIICSDCFNLIYSSISCINLFLAVDSCTQVSKGLLVNNGWLGLFNTLPSSLL